jgi:protocatechuate 3,4-dioxygenase beta subunit/type II secretory pathway pseudopilin PulG
MTNLRHRHHGFSTLEVVLALTVFLVVAAGLASAATRMASSAVRTESRAAVGAMLDRQLDVLAARPFDSLLGNFDAPDPCGDSGTADGKLSCVTIGTAEYRVAYSVAAGDDPATGPGQSASSVTLTATTRLPDGTDMSATRVVVAPQVGFTADGAVLRITATSDDVPPAVNILDAAGDVVVDGVPFDGSVAVARVPGDACAVGTGGPCRVALSVDPNNWWRSGNLTLAPAQITGSGLVLSAGTLTDTTIDVAPVAAARIRVLARPTGSGNVGGAPTQTVCVWATFDDGTSVRSVPYCNTGTSDAGVAGAHIPLDAWPDPVTGEDRPFSDGMAVAVSAEKPGATTCDPASSYPYGAPLGAAAGNSWVVADVCSTWTWGVPTLFGATGDTASSFAGGATVRPSADVRSYDLIFTETDLALNPVGRPATGAGNVAPWTKPRAAASAPLAGCATDANAATLCQNSTAAANTPTPETAPGAPAGCATNPYCFSFANAAPRLTAPSGTRAVLTPASDTSFELRAADPEGAGVSLRVVDGAGVGPARIFNDATGTAIGTAPVTPASPGVWTLRYNWDPARPVGGWGPSVEWIAVELSDDGGATWSAPVRVSFYEDNGPFRIDAEPVSLSQAEATATYRARLIDAEGAVISGADLAIGPAGGALPDLIDDPVTATTGSDGYATFDLPVGTAPAQLYGLAVVSVDDPGIIATTTVNVTQAPGAVTVAATPTAAQGGTLSATVTVTDTTGAALPGTAVVLSGARSGAPTTKLRPAAGACVTDPTGVCAATMNVASDAPAGSYDVVATVDDISGTAPLEVTPTVAGIAAGDGATGTSGYSAAVAASSPFSHWTMDESAGPLVDVVEGRNMVVSGAVRRGQPPLTGAVGSGSSVGFDADGAKACSPSLTLPATGATVETWVELSSHKSQTARWSEVFGIRAGSSNEFALSVGDGTDQTRPTLWLHNGGVVRKVVAPAGLDTQRAYHLAGTYRYDSASNTTTARLYVDGAQVASSTFSGQVSATGAACAGAMSSAVANMALHGKVDEAAVYTSALSAATISQHHAAGGVDGARGSLTVPQGGAASLKVTVTDGAGDPMAGQSVAVASTSASIGVGASTVTTGPAGTVNVGVTTDESAAAGTIDGAVTLTAAGKTLAVDVAVRQVPANLALGAASVARGGRGQMVATVTDTAGDPVAGARVTFEVTGGAPNGLRLSSAATTDGDGDAVAVITPTSSTPLGPVTVRARLSSLSSSATLTVVDGVSLERPSREAAPVRLVAGGSAEWAYKVVDSSGAPVAGTDVILSCDSCGLAAIPAAMFTDGDGWARTTITDTGGVNPTGNYTMTAVVSGQSIPTIVTVTADAAAIEADTSTRTVTRGETTTFRVRVVDGAGNGASGVAVTAGADLAGGLRVRPARTDAFGYATVAVSAGDSVGDFSVALRAGDATTTLELEVTP